MSLESTNLPDDVQSLKQIIFSLQLQNDHLQEMVRLLQNEIFGRKSEALPAVNSNQLPLFASDAPVEPIEKDDDIVVPAHTRKKHGRKPLPADLPRVEIVHDLPETEKRCACGAELSRIGEDTCEKLDYIPAKVQVIRHIRPKYACKHCEGVEDVNGPTVRIAPPPAQLIPKSIATEGLLAHIAVSKFADALPLHRQQKIFGRLGVDLSRATLANWMIQAAGCCQPIVELLTQEVRSGPLINVDESPFQVLREPGRSDTTKSYMWVFCGGPLDAPAILYQYHPTRSGKVVCDMLDDYLGYVQSDGYSGYDQLSRKPGIIHLGCLTHARRKFVEVNKGRKARGRQKTSKGLADEALDFIGALYGIEKVARENDLSDEKIRNLRQEKAKPILDRFKTWLDTYHPQVPPKSLLGKAIQYALNQWEKLVVYIDAGFLKPDNNVAENAIRPFVLGRKNWLFSGAPRGADASATFFSLIETAKANGLEPYAYLRYLFAKLPLARTTEDYQALLPKNIDRDALSAMRH